MTKIANISLDIRKNNTVDNEPIILRQGDSDVIIEASISNNGYPNIEIDFATFVAKKSDGTIISNDPVNISGNVISYPVSKHLTESVGKIQDAYFMINNQITTCGFDISIIPSTQLDDTSVNYIPGIESINKFLESAEADWLGRIQQMKAQIDGLDIPNEFKLLMDKALSDAKAQYQPTIDAAEENVENIVAELASKKLDLENSSDELNKTIATIKAQVTSINSFLDKIQKQIIEANTSFITGQQAEISKSISDGQKKLADSIASMQSKFETDSKNLKSQGDQVIADLKNSSNSAITDMQNNQSTAMAKVNQDITDTKAIMQKMQNVAVGTNLYTDTRDFDNPSVWPEWSSYFKTGEKFNGLTVVGTKSDWNGLGQVIQAKKGETYTFSVYARYQSGTGKSSMFYSIPNGVNVDTWGQTLSLNETWQRLTGTMTITADGPIKPRLERSDNNTNVLLIAGPKVEKGSIATDYSLNPLDVSTSTNVQTAITNALSDIKTQIQNSAVGTNLLLKTYKPFSVTGNNDEPMHALSRRLEKGTTVTLSFDAVSTAPTKFNIQNNGSDNGTWMSYITDSVDTTKKHYVSTITLDGYSSVGTYIHLGNIPSTANIIFSNMKLELGSHATDYSLNPSDITNALGDVNAKVKELETKVDKLSPGK